MQKKAIRSALNAPYNSHTDPLFAEINSLKFEDQYQLNASKFANQIIEGEAPWGVSSSFKIIKPDKDSRHRKCTTLFVPTCRTDATQRMCSYTIPTIFNSQPEYFRNQGTKLLKDNFVLDKIEKYKSFECTKKKCYSCHRN
jgi:hypothetical protein